MEQLSIFSVDKSAPSRMKRQRKGELLTGHVGIAIHRLLAADLATKSVSISTASLNMDVRRNGEDPACMSLVFMPEMLSMKELYQLRIWKINSTEQAYNYSGLEDLPPDVQPCMPQLFKELARARDDVVIRTSLYIYLREEN